MQHQVIIDAAFKEKDIRLLAREAPKSEYIIILNI
jgi:hypothetical protein